MPLKSTGIYSPLGALLLVCSVCFSGQLFSAGLNIQVNGLASVEGRLVVRIYNSADGFPKDEDKANVTREYQITAANMWLTYGQLAPGEYAIVVFHDKNSNGILDTNFLGIPKEAIGASGNKKGYPTFRKSRFDITEAMQVKVIEITLSELF